MPPPACCSEILNVEAVDDRYIYNRESLGAAEIGIPVGGSDVPVYTVA